MSERCLECLRARILTLKEGGKEGEREGGREDWG